MGVPGGVEGRGSREVGENDGGMEGAWVKGWSEATGNTQCYFIYDIFELRTDKKSTLLVSLYYFINILIHVVRR